MIWLKSRLEQSLAAVVGLGKRQRDGLVWLRLEEARRRHLDEFGKNVISAPSAVSAIERRALDYFEALEATPLHMKALACAMVIIAVGFLYGLIPGSVDIFIRDDIFYPAVVISALLCGVVGGLVAVAVFSIFAHLGLGAMMLGRLDEPVHFAASFDFLFGAAGYIVLARFPHLLARARHASEAAIRAEVEQLRDFVQQAPAAIAMFDREMHYLGASARWCEARGLDREIGGNWHYAELPNFPQAWKDAHRRALAGEAVRSEQDHIVRADGREAWVRWEVQPWRLNSGEIGGVVIVSEDITERVRMQQALHDNERRVTAIFDSAMDAIVTSDRNGAIISANPAAQDVFGYSLQELLGKNINQLMPEPYVLRHNSNFDAYLRGDGKQIIGQRRVVEGRRKNDETFPLELTVSEAGMTDDLLFVGIMRDLSPIEAERRRVSLLREELAHVSRVNDMGETVAGLAHEVGQPVAAILNFAAAYRRARATIGKAAETDLIAKIEEQARRAAEIIKRLRGFIEKRPPERRAVAVESLIDDALSLVHLRTRPRIVRTPPGPEVAGVQVFVDPIQIEQVLINLLRNADDALIDAEAPEITIETSRSDSGHVMVSVADNGVGVEDGAAAELFDPFFTTKHRGMGVGLSIGKSIVESHGGAIFYRPNAPRGSIFEFELPLYAPKPR